VGRKPVPGLQTIGRQPAHREHQLAAGDNVFQASAAIAERPPGQVSAVVAQQVERHEKRRRGDAARIEQESVPGALTEVDRHPRTYFIGLNTQDLHVEMPRQVRLAPLVPFDERLRDLNSLH
jgi:hypothetical protein